MEQVLQRVESLDCFSGGHLELEKHRVDHAYINGKVINVALCMMLLRQLESGD